MRRILQFSLLMDDPFQVRLESAIKSLRHGTRNPFFINLCRALFGAMSESQMRDAMAKIGYSAPDALKELLLATQERLDAAAQFKAPVVEHRKQHQCDDIRVTKKPNLRSLVDH